MKCKKCGAEIPQGYVYCRDCGEEVQLVPDYNLLDEDLLGGIVQKEAKAGYEKSDIQKNKKAKLSIVIWGSICFVLLIAVFTLFFVFYEVRNRQINTYSYQYQKAEECFKAKDFSEAVLYYKKALEFLPKDKQARKHLLETYLAMKNEKAAVSLLEEIAAEDSSDRETIKKLIEIYEKNKEYDKILVLREKVNNSECLELFLNYIVEQPEFNYISGIYQEPLTIMLSSKKEYDIFYTTDGRDPVAYGKVYENEISLEKEGTTVIRAAACNEKGIYSEIAEADYTIRYEPPAMPVVTPAGGTYDEPQSIVISVPRNCTAYYTWDGSDPTEGSFRYTGPLEMPPGNQVLSVILINSAGLKSSIYRVNYIYMP